MYDFGRLSNERVKIFLQAGKMEDGFYDTLKNEYVIVRLKHDIHTNRYGLYIPGVLVDKVIAKQINDCIYV